MKDKIKEFINKEKLMEVVNKVKEKAPIYTKKVVSKVKEKAPVYMAKLKDVALKIKENAPIYLAKLKEQAIKIKENAPVYLAKLKEQAIKIKENAPIYKEKCVNYVKNNKKQVIVGCVIFIIAILLLIASVPSKKKQDITQAKVPTQVVHHEKVALPEAKVIEETEKLSPDSNLFFNFTATAKNAFNYQIFYTIKDEVWYSPKYVISFSGQAGENTYKIKIPAEKVYRIRLDFDAENEEITVSNIYLSGDQNADLNNFNDYLFNDIAEKTINKDGSLTVITKEQDPHIGYYIK
ncbi:MAG: hypothetical protein IJE43_09950 [Alphaproteobacteria bacterium]|nr:hypothetical protein [Alphaproteobacteria bacterium]